VLDGKSLGHALLEARQRYADQATELDPIDLKTLAQFLLLGDPSVHAVLAPTPTELPKRADAEESRRSLRHGQRARMKVAGRLLCESKPTASRARAVAGVGANLRKTLASIAKRSGLASAECFRAYPVKLPKALRGARAPAAAKARGMGFASRYFVAVRKRAGATKPLDLVAVVAKEVAGRIVAYRVYERR
jgi:hypothetical protein